MEWQAIAAVAAGVAALVVMWQSWETRKAAQASRQAVDVAGEALELARIEEGHSRSLLREAVRARIDAATPSITLDARREPLGVVEMTAAPLGTARQTVPEGKVFRLPKDGMNYLCITFRVTIANDSDQHVTILPSYMLRGAGPQEDPIRLAPGNYETIEFEIWRSVKDWVEGQGRSNFGGTSWWSGFSARYFDTKDTGAGDTWTVDVMGSVLEPVPDETASYRLASATNGATLSQPQHKRTYYLSRSAGEVLPSLDELR